MFGPQYFSQKNDRKQIESTIFTIGKNWVKKLTNENI